MRKLSKVSRALAGGFSLISLAAFLVVFAVIIKGPFEVLMLFILLLTAGVSYFSGFILIKGVVPGNADKYM